MKPESIIIYSRKSNESIVAKNKAKKENPKAVIIESSNTKVLKEALKGKGTIVHNFDSKLDLRKLKGEKVKTNTKKKADKKAAAPKKEAKAKKPADKKKAAPKKAAKKKPEAKKAPAKKKKTTTKKKK